MKQRITQMKPKRFKTDEGRVINKPRRKNTRHMECGGRYNLIVIFTIIAFKHKIV